VSKGRVRSTKRRSRRQPKAELEAHYPQAESIYESHPYPQKGSPKFLRFIGISLAGGKTDKTAVSVLEYYPVQKKVFLSRLFDKVKSEDEVSSDLLVHRMVTQCPGKVESVAFDVPLRLPKCLRCKLKCPGYEVCDQPEIEWMWKHYHANKSKKSPAKLFTPYTERCVEQYLQSQLEEPFQAQHALGSNLAPLTARALFISRRLNVPLIEVYPKLSLWRIGSSLEVPKSHLRFHRHWEAGNDSRTFVIKRLLEKNIAFIYDQDVKTLVDSRPAFDSFICAMTGLLTYLGQCEARPKGFPRSEAWIEIPSQTLAWP
jgi:hypothetical protein